MKAVTKPQLQKLHVLLRQMGFDDDFKREAVSKITKGRTTSSRELNMSEAQFFINQLEKHNPRTRMQHKVFALAYEAGIIWGDTPEDKKMNAAKIDQFLQARGTVKKPLNQLNHAELVRTVNQFEAIVKHNNEGRAKKVTDTLLQELNISTS
jgi:hypothetical protein